jgi:hypothetical protein
MKKSDRCPTCGHRQRRSRQQNALYWLLLHLVAEKLRPGGLLYSPEQWHWYMKSRFLGCDEIPLPGGKQLTMPRSSAGLAVDEFNEFFGKVEAWSNEHDVFLADREGT